jgi:hypothetical protein
MKQVEFIVFLSAMIMYIRHIILHKEFTPNPVSFGIWLLVDIANAITYLNFSSHWIAPIIMLGGAITIFSLSAYRSKRQKIQLKTFDWICIVASVASLCIYGITGKSQDVNVIIQIILVIGFLPMIKHLLKTKSSEPYCLGHYLVLVGQ